MGGVESADMRLRRKEVLEAYPYLELGDIRAALSYAAWRLEELEVKITPLEAPPRYEPLASSGCDSAEAGYPRMSCTVILVPRKVGLPLRKAGRCGCTPGISYSRGTGRGSADQGKVQAFNNRLQRSETASFT